MSTLNPALHRNRHPTIRSGPTGPPVAAPSIAGTRSPDWSTRRLDTPCPPALPTGDGSASAGAVAERPRTRQA
ncbi:hypothetical protein [Saccharothrix xinjiangensis]|uniref:Uncharacterized protein n=1 Tax=Saccharothrix xinjiangensis TaxID=204798 RepID=A0ABV9XX25_9PSEU